MMVLPAFREGQKGPEVHDTKDIIAILRLLSPK